MQTHEAIKVLLTWSRQGRVVFTRSDLRMIFWQDKEYAFKQGLNRLVSKGVLNRVAKGIFVFVMSERRNPDLLEKIATALRRGCYNYLSLETALSEYGIISQVPLAGITVMTTGRAGLFKTPFGNIEFIHTKRDVTNILKSTKDVGRPLRLATPQAAVRDLRRVGRNVHLIDEEEFQEVLEDGE